MVTLISGAHGIFPYLQTGLLCGGVESAAIETAVNIAHILNERPLPGSAVATPNGVNWAKAERQLFSPTAVIPALRFFQALDRE